jgi:hypothetical protein
MMGADRTILLSWRGRWLKQVVVVDNASKLYQSKIRGAVGRPSMRLMSFPFAATSRRTPSSIYLPACLLIGPVLLLLFPALPFANDKLCDEWYVFGLFHNLPEAVRWWPGQRQTGRFAEILPGFVFTRLLPGTYSDYAQFLLFFGLSQVLIFKSAETLFCKSRAALATIFFSCSPLVVALYAVTCDGPVVTYISLSLFGVSRAVAARSARSCLAWMLLSGLGWGAAINAHLAAASFGVSAYLFFAARLLLNQTISFRSRVHLIAKAAVVVVLGVSLLHLFLAALAALVFKASPWIVLNQEFQAATIFAKEKISSDWYAHWYLRDAKMGWFSLGLAMAAVQFFSCLRKLQLPQAWTNSDRSTLAIATSFVASFGLWVVFEMTGGIFLQYETYYIMMWPFLTLTLFSGDLGWDGERRFALVPLYLIACLLCLVPGVAGLWRFSREAHAGTSVIIAAGVVALCVMVLNTRWQVGRTLVAAGILSLLALVGLVTRPYEGYAIWSSKGGEARRSYARLHAGIEFTLRLTKASRQRPVIWTNEHETSDGAGFVDSFLYCDVNRDFPEVDPEDMPIAGDFVVALARPETLTTQLEAAARRLSVSLKTVGTMMLRDERGPYDIVVMSVTAAPP